MGQSIVGWLNTKMFDETHDEQKSQGWTALVHGHQRQRQARRVRRSQRQPIDPAKDKLIDGALYAVGAGAGRIDLGHRSLGYSRRDRPADARIESDRKRRSRRVYRVPSDKDTPASRRAAAMSIATASTGSALGERPPRELRSPQVQGPAQRPERHRPALPRRLDALHRAGAAVQGRQADSGSAEAQLLHLGRSVRHARPRRNTPINTGNASEGAARAEGWQVGDAARAVPDRASTRSGWTAASTIPNAGWKGRGLWATISTRRRSTWRPGRATTTQGDEASRCVRIPLAK